MADKTFPYKAVIFDMDGVISIPRRTISASSAGL